MTVSKDCIILNNSLHLKFRALNCVSISQPLKRLSELFVQWSSQKHLFGKFSANYYQNICSGVYFE